MYNRFFSGVSKIERGIEWVQKVVYLLLLATLIFTIFFQVIGRYLIGLATPWAEELARYSFVWISWIIGAYSLRRGGHIVMNLIDPVLQKARDPGKAFYWMSKVTYTVVAAFMCVVLHYFWQYFMRTVRGNRSSIACGIPMWIILLGVLIGIVLSIVQSIYILLTPYQEEETKETEGGEEAC